MTNAEIIMQERISLMNDGIIGTTGRKVKLEYEDENGNKKSEVMYEPEEIHTYQAWKSLGFQVKKGEHAIASFTIWKYSQKQTKNSDIAEEKMFLKRAHFFRRAQVMEVIEQA